MSALEIFTQEELNIIDEMAAICDIPLHITNGYDDESTDLNEPHFYNMKNGEHLTLIDGIKIISQAVIDNYAKVKKYTSAHYRNMWIIILEKFLIINEGKE